MTRFPARYDPRVDPAAPGHDALPSLRRPLVVAAAAVVVLLGVEHFASLAVTVAFSALVAILCRRLQLALLGRGLAGWLALTITLGAFVVVLIALFVAAVGAAAVVAVQVSDDADQIAARISDALDQLDSLIGTPSGTVPSIDASALASAAKGLLGSLASTVTSLAMSVLIVAYLLLDARRLRARMLSATSAASVARFDALAAELVTYIRVRAILGGAAAIADTVLLYLVGVPNPVLWGVVSFMFSFVPNIGFLIALIPPAVIAFVQLGLGPAILVVLGYLAINTLFDYVLQPKMMEADLDLSPVVVITTILIWTAIIGPMGALLAVPLTMALRAVLVPFAGARWFVALLGPVPDDPAAAASSAPTIEG